MRKIDIDYVDIGSILSKPIYGTDSMMLLNKGAILTLTYIERLKKTGVSSVYIDDGFIDDVSDDQILSEETRRKAVQNIKSVFHNIKHDSIEDISPVKIIVTRIIDELSASSGVLLCPSDISLYDEYVYNHSVNVAAISIIIGMSLKYDKKKLYDLGVAGMLHDIGKTKIPTEILNKPAKLSNEEYELVKKHAFYGYELLLGNPKIDTGTPLIALQHHERYDGTGYPKGLKNKAISEFAQIMAIADVYDAMGSDKYYRKSIPSHEIYRFLLENSGKLFNPALIDKFLENMALYPKGTMVMLSDGQAGFVVSQNYSDPKRPVLRLFWDRDGTEISNIVEVNLLEETQLEIFQVIEGKMKGIKQTQAT